MELHQACVQSVQIDIDSAAAAAAAAASVAAAAAKAAAAAAVPLPLLRRPRTLVSREDALPCPAQDGAAEICSVLSQRLEVLEQRFEHEEKRERPLIWQRLKALEHRLDDQCSHTIRSAESRPSAVTEFGESTDELRSLQRSVSILQDTCVSHSEALDRSLADFSVLKEEVKCCLTEEIREKVCAMAQSVGSELWTERSERMLGQQLLQDTLQSQQEFLTQLAELVDSSLMVQKGLSSNLPSHRESSDGAKKEQDHVCPTKARDSTPVQAVQWDQSLSMLKRVTCQLDSPCRQAPAT